MRRSWNHSCDGFWSCSDGCAVAACFAAPPPAARAEIDGLLSRLETSSCEFNRNGTWHSATEAKSHLLVKLKYLEDRGAVDSAEQFIELAASKSSMSGQPYLVRCANSAPVSEQRLAAVPAAAHARDRRRKGRTIVRQRHRTVVAVTRIVADKLETKMNRSDARRAASNRDSGRFRADRETHMADTTNPARTVPRAGSEPGGPGFRNALRPVHGAHLHRRGLRGGSGQCADPHDVHRRAGLQSGLGAGRRGHVPGSHRHGSRQAAHADPLGARRARRESRVCADRAIDVEGGGGPGHRDRDRGGSRPRHGADRRAGASRAEPGRRARRAGDLPDRGGRDLPGGAALHDVRRCRCGQERVPGRCPGDAVPRRGSRSGAMRVSAPGRSG